jgi:hypothetical protein
MYKTAQFYSLTTGYAAFYVSSFTLTMLSLTIPPTPLPTNPPKLNACVTSETC